MLYSELLQEADKESKKIESEKSPAFFYYFDDEWRKPLSKHQYLFFKVLCQIPIHNHTFTTFISLLPASPYNERRAIERVLKELRDKGYIKTEQDRKYFKRGVDSFRSRIRIYCYAPDGTIVNHESLNKELFNAQNRITF